MKRVIILFVAVVCFWPAIGQNIFDNLVDKYSDREGFSAVQLSNDMFDLYLKKKNIPKDDPIYGVIEKLDNILVVINSNLNEESKKNELNPVQKEILEYYKTEDYTLFKTEKNANSDLKIFVKKDGEEIASLGVVNLSGYSLTLVEINGAIELSSIAQLNKAFNIRGLETLSRIDNSSNFFLAPDLSNFRVPDFSDLKISEHIQLDIAEDLKKAQEEMRIGQLHELEEQRALLEEQEEFIEKYKRIPIILRGNTEYAEYYINDKKVNMKEIEKLDTKKIQEIKVVSGENAKSASQIRITLKK